MLARLAPIVLANKGEPTLALDFIAMAVAAMLDQRVTLSRASNATQFDSQGRLVWAPANLLTWGNDFSKADWAVAGSASKTGTNQFNFTASTGDKVNHLAPLSTSTPGVSWTFSITLSGSGIIQLYCYDYGGSFPGIISTQLTLTGTPTRYFVTRVHSDAAATSVVAQIVNGTAAASTVICSNAQLERTGVDSPKPYIDTQGSAVYGPRFDFDPSTVNGYSAIGTQLVTDPGCDTPSAWFTADDMTDGSGWAVTGGRIVATNAFNSGLEQTAVNWVVGRWYRLSFDYVVSASFFLVYLGQGVQQIAGPISGTGTSSVVFQANVTNAKLLFQSGGGANTSGTIDNVSVVEVVPNCPPLGLLIEESRTNGFPSHTGFSAWSAQVGIGFTNNVAGIADPSASQTATLLTKTAAMSYVAHGSAPKTSAAALPYTFSVYVKANTATFVALRIQGTYPAMVNVCFNLVGAGSISTAAALSGSFTSPSATIQSVGGGWYRVSLSGVTDAYTSALVGLAPLTATGQMDSTDASTTASLYAWGAQWEAGLFPTSLIPTYGTVATRSVDFVSMTGSNFSGWFKSTRGTVVGEWKDHNQGSSGSCGLFSLNDGTSSNKIDFRAINGQSMASGGTGWTLTTGNPTVGTLHKMALSFVPSAQSISRDGATVVTASAANMPSGINMLQIGGLDNSTGYALNGHIRRLVYYGYRLTDAQLQGLST